MFLWSVAADSFKLGGRKTLLQLSENVSTLIQAGKKGLSEEEKQEHTFSSEPQNIPFAVPGMLLLCCGVLCPCFHAKRKEESEHSVLDRQQNSSE